MKTQYKRTALALLVMLAIGGTLSALVLFRPLRVEVIEPASGVPVEVFGLGTVEARIVSNIGFEVGAALVELNADHGDHVAPGEVLARLHSAQQEARVARARAGVVNAEAALQKARATVGKARAVLAQKTQVNQRKQALLKKQTVAVEDADEAQMQQEVAAADLAVAISDVEVASAALEDARSMLALEQVLLAQHTLTAPYSAVVTRRHEELGTVLTPGEPLFTLVDPQTVWALAYVDETRAGSIAIGQAAEVHLRSLPGSVFEGRVTRIDIESDRVSEERRVYISCERCPEQFHLGEQVEVFIRTAVLDDALLVPESTIDGFNGSTGTVWTVQDGELRRRELTFGYRTLDARAQVARGLPAGSAVLRSLRPGLSEGRSVRVVDAES